MQRSPANAARSGERLLERKPLTDAERREEKRLKWQEEWDALYSNDSSGPAAPKKSARGIGDVAGTGDELPARHVSFDPSHEHRTYSGVRSGNANLLPPQPSWNSLKVSDSLGYSPSLPSTALPSPTHSSASCVSPSSSGIESKLRQHLQPCEVGALGLHAIQLENISRMATQMHQFQAEAERAAKAEIARWQAQQITYQLQAQAAALAAAQAQAQIQAELQAAAASQAQLQQAQFLLPPHKVASPPARRHDPAELEVVRYDPWQRPSRQQAIMTGNPYIDEGFKRMEEQADILQQWEYRMNHGLEPAAMSRAVSTPVLPSTQHDCVEARQFRRNRQIDMAGGGRIW
eukprot:TRINITY_DN105590_c0_g1_i1.p1 TRINITY_DN105590_c0_g1~~TRINITY_DN105590_c0_g1_i1.p1  ORF type:complete len:347 (-),score=64.65 TRINITY_DN105590_c0_g1_i1:233-1273(-)